MAVVNIHGQPAPDQRELTLLSAWFFGRPCLPSPKFWLSGIAFLALYLAFNKLTEWHQFDGLGITLWSPDNGLSLLLLTEGVVFAPFVFLGAVLTDVFITGVPHSLYVTVAAELVLTAGYVGLATVLRDKLKFDPRQVRLADIVVLLTFAPAGTTLTSLSYCGVLYLGGAIPADQFYAAMRHFWIGDTVGIITIIPAATSVFAFLSKARWRWSGYELVSCSVFILGTCLGFAVLFGVGDANEYHLFYLLFLPIIWVGMREGYAGVAVALLAIQLGLVVTTTYFGIEAKDFSVFQMLMLVLSIAGLLLGAVITEREQAAQLLRQQQTELSHVSAYAIAGAMGMALAHEISQPLSTVASYLHAARRLLQSGAARAPVMDALSKAEMETRRTREVLERVRDFVSSGKLDLKPLDLSNLALKIGALCREEATARGIHVEIENIRAIPLVRADRIQIEQVLNNLVTPIVAKPAKVRGNVMPTEVSPNEHILREPGSLQLDPSGEGVAIDETKRLIASNKVEGTPVYKRDEEQLGNVYNFMVDKYTGQVAYAVMSFGGFLGLGESYHPLPWKVLTYDTRLEGYVVDLDRERLKNAPRYGVGEEPFADPVFGQRLGDYYGAR